MPYILTLDAGTSAVKCSLADESLRIVIPVICNDTVAQALHLRDGIGSSAYGNCRQNAAQKRRHAQQYREKLIFFHNASYRTQPRR